MSSTDGEVPPIPASPLADGSTPRSRARLVDELVDDRITLVGDPAMVELVVEELDHTRRIPVFEGRRPVYGAIIRASPGPLQACGFGVDLLDAPRDIDQARTYADGRYSFLLRDQVGAAAGTALVACFDRPLQFEADLLLLQEASGATIVQRTPVLAVTRVFQPGEVVTWNGRSWTARPTATSLLPVLTAAAPDLRDDVAQALLEFALHWLSPSRGGATLVVHPAAGKAELEPSLDRSTAVRPPPLHLTDRRHLPALLSSLLQRDLATLVGADGTVHAVGVGLRPSEGAQRANRSDRGMRHRSAQAWSVDHPAAVVATVSEDGPVTVYRAGAVIINA